MRKQLTVLLTLCVFWACGASAVFAKSKTAPNIAGTWMASGKASIKVDVEYPAANPRSTLATLSVQLKNVGIIGEEFIFGTATGGTGAFSDTLLGISDSDAGTYTIANSGAFTVDIDTWVANVNSTLLSLAKSLDPTASITIENKSFTGKASSANSMKGNINVEFTVKLPGLKLSSINGLSIPVGITASLSAKPATLYNAYAVSSTGGGSAVNTATFIFEKLIVPAVRFSGK